MVSGEWCVVSGEWCVVSGVWCVVLSSPQARPSKG